jgi:glycosyltransferase involved in cell wall biosynthesis
MGANRRGRGAGLPGAAERLRGDTAMDGVTPPPSSDAASATLGATLAGSSAVSLDGPVAWIAGQYPRATDTFIMREVAGLRALGVDVRTFSIRRTGPEHLVGPEQRAEAAGTTHVLEAAKRPGEALRAHIVGWRAPRPYLRSLRDAWATAAPGLRGRAYNLIYWHEAVVLAALLRSMGVVHLHCHIAKAACTVARLAAPLAGVTWSFTLHGPDDLEEPGQWALRDKIARADHVACISSYARSQAMFHSRPRDWDKLHVVHCGIEPARYDRSGDLAAEAPPGSLLFVGRLAAAKGVPVLLGALRIALGRDPSLTLTLVGDGPERPGLEALAQGLPATFLGTRNQAEVAALLARHRALVLPSFAEGVPVVLMEAMASGRPVVTTRIAGIAELVEDGVSGRVVPPGEEEALAEAILEVLADEGLGRRMGEAGRARVRAEFDSRREAGRMAALLRHARRGGPRPARRPEEA